MVGVVLLQVAVKFVETLLTHSHLVEELLVGHLAEEVGAGATEYFTTAPEICTVYGQGLIKREGMQLP